MYWFKETFARSPFRIVKAPTSGRTRARATVGSCLVLPRSHKAQNLFFRALGGFSGTLGFSQGLGFGV